MWVYREGCSQVGTVKRTARYEVGKKGKRILGEEYCPVGIVSAQDLKWEGLQCLQVGIRRSL